MGPIILVTKYITNLHEYLTWCRALYFDPASWIIEFPRAAASRSPFGFSLPVIVTRGVQNTRRDGMGTGRTLTVKGILKLPSSQGSKMPKKIMTDDEFMAICNKAYKDFKGDVREFERAVGTLYVARYIGWKPIYLIQDRKSLKKYEDYLGIKFQEVTDPAGKDADRSVAWSLLQKAKEKLTNFWAVVRGESGTDIRTPEFKSK